MELSHFVDHPSCSLTAVVVIYSRPINLSLDPAFDNVKIYHRKDVVMAYPCLSKPFEIYTDASTLQIGAVIIQENRPIAFFSQNSLARNLNTPLPNQSSQPKEFLINCGIIPLCTIKLFAVVCDRKAVLHDASAKLIIRLSAKGHQLPSMLSSDQILFALYQSKQKEIVFCPF